MMYVEGREVSVDAEQGSTLLDLLLTVQESQWKDNKNICEVVVDGEAINPLTEETLQAIVYENQKVEIKLTDKKPAPSLKGTIAEAIQYLEGLPLALEKLAEQIRLSPSASAFEELKQSLESMGFILTLLNLVKVDKHLSSAIKEQIESLLSEINDVLLELNEAQEKEDLTLLSDLIEYDMPDNVQKIVDIFRNFLENR
ncbi:MAG: hypothetical protein CSA81_04375 [Acidobacteria bacterium]|nr:MAG: hypothetical protein CSA81_04375 [Acidobacteriota bacterium]